MINFFSGLILAFRSYSKALYIIRKCKLGWVFIIPLVLLVANVYLGGSMSAHLTDIVVDWIHDLVPYSLGDSWLAGFFRTIATFFVWLSFFFILIYIGGFVLLILLSPVLAYASQRVDSYLSGEDFPFRVNEFIADVVRGLKIALRNLLVEISYSIVSIIIGFIPLVGLAVPAYLLGVAAYFYGFSFMDYTLERHRLSVRESVLFVRKHRGVAVGLGLVYMLFTMIPYVGFALAGFIAILSVVAATISTRSVLGKV